MPRDPRLYMTFPNDFWQHPKIELLSDAAFRAFVEMNGYSRMQDLDGVISVAIADRRWKKSAISELLASHPERPVLLHVDDTYVLRDYAEHQETRATREARRERNTANGRRGGRPRKNPTETQSVTRSDTESDTGSVREENPEETETKAEIEIEELPDGSSSPPNPPRGARGDRIPEPFIVTAQMRIWAADNAPTVDVDRTTEEFVDYWRGVPGVRGRKLDWPATWRNRIREVSARNAQRRPSPTSRAQQTVAAGQALAARREGLLPVTTLNPRKELT